MIPLESEGDSWRLVAEINVTPFIDVVLVLPGHLHGGRPAGHGRGATQAAAQRSGTGFHPAPLLLSLGRRRRSLTPRNRDDLGGQDRPAATIRNAWFMYGPTRAFLTAMLWRCSAGWGTRRLAAVLADRTRNRVMNAATEVVRMQGAPRRASGASRCMDARRASPASGLLLLVLLIVSFTVGAIR